MKSDSQKNNFNPIVPISGWGFYFCSVRPAYISKGFVEKFVQVAWEEDVGSGDHATQACILPEMQGQAQVIAKEQGTIAGVEWAVILADAVDSSLRIDCHVNDGMLVSKGQRILTLRGSMRSILTLERTLLNCLQRMSGIATKTNHLVSLIAGSGAKLLDTRKTTPGFRYLEKWAVLIGGGSNHRMGLFDMVMLKDNHIDMSGGIETAIHSTRKYLHEKALSLKVEIEARSLEDVKEVMRIGGVDIIMLDNMSVEDMQTAVQLISGRYLVEASGNITEESIRQVANTGVDFISVGALTHSYKSLDLSLIVN